MQMVLKFTKNFKTETLSFYNTENKKTKKVKRKEDEKKTPPTKHLDF